jgi:hypothetical protein
MGRVVYRFKGSVKELPTRPYLKSSKNPEREEGKVEDTEPQFPQWSDQKV